MFCDLLIGNSQFNFRACQTRYKNPYFVNIFTVTTTRVKTSDFR